MHHSQSPKGKTLLAIFQKKPSMVHELTFYFPEIKDNLIVDHLDDSDDNDSCQGRLRNVLEQGG